MHGLLINVAIKWSKVGYCKVIEPAILRFTTALAVKIAVAFTIRERL